MKLVVVIAEFITGALLVTKAITGKPWAQVINGQAEAAYKNGQALGTSNAEGTVTGATSSSASLPIITSKGGGRLNANQLTFANHLQQLTGLNIAVIKGWLIGEEPATSSQAPNGANNWLNVGSTDSGYYGGSNPVWRNPITAAQATAAWLKGTPIGGSATYSATTYPGASSGIQAILGTIGQGIAKQVQAIQNSGWASGHYPNLPSFVSEFL